MNDENLENYLFGKFNAVLDGQFSEDEKQEQLGKLFFEAANCASAIYLVNHQDETKELLKMTGGMNFDVNLKKLLENEWYIYTNLNIWLDYIHSLYNEIKPTHPKYSFFTQVMTSIDMIEEQAGIKTNQYVS